MTTPDILEAAADLLFVYGRARCKFIDEEGRMCITGAIAVASEVEIEGYNVAGAQAMLTAGESRFGADACVVFGHHLFHQGLVGDRWLNVEELHPVNFVFMVQHFNDALCPPYPFKPENDAKVLDLLRTCAKELR